MTYMLGPVLVAHGLHGALRLPHSLTPHWVHLPLQGRGGEHPPCRGIFALRAHCALLLDYVPPEQAGDLRVFTVLLAPGTHLV